MQIGNLEPKPKSYFLVKQNQKRHNKKHHSNQYGYPKLKQQNRLLPIEHLEKLNLAANSMRGRVFF